MTNAFRKEHMHRAKPRKKYHKNRIDANLKITGAVLPDLSKAFTYVDHKLLIAYLHAYVINGSALLFVHSCLDSRKRRVAVKFSFSMWAKIWVKVKVKGLSVPQCSVLGSLIFKIYLNDLFLFLEETEDCNYADDNNLCMLS